MKRILSIVLALCMVLCALPSVSFAADTTLSAVRTAYFNSKGDEWKSTDGDNVLVSTGATGWAGASSFTDTDGTVTEQTSLAGTNFGSARHALIAFTIPAGFDPDNTAKVTLSMKVKNVKQVTSGARLSVYGNSIDGTWSVSGNTVSDFGVSGSTSGLESLTLLGLTDAIETGNQTNESPSNETITLSSQKLTSYVCQTAREGKTEVTFRLAAPLGGIRIYDTTTSAPPTLTIEEGKVTTVKVKTVYKDGETVVSSSEETVSNITAGSTYTYAGTPAISQTVDGVVYVYSAENSTLTTVAKEDGSGLITLVYNKYDYSNTFSGYEVDDEGAWCWFADPRSISYKNADGSIDISILGYIDVHGNIKATQINHGTNTVDEVLIRSNIQPDDHNNPTFLVLPDERIIVFYSRHTDEACFWYRVTKEKGDLTTLGEEKCLNTSANTTYPSPFLMENDPTHIYLCWRGINWHPTIAKLDIPDEDGNTRFVYGPYQMVASTGDSSSIRPYAKYASNGVDKIYVTYTTGHPDNEQPNWVYFNAINISDMTLEDIKGNTLSTIANGPLSVNKTDTSQSFIVDTAPENMRDWVWQTAIGADGKPVIAMVRINGGKTSHDYYYVKWNGSEWTATFLANGGGHFHQSPHEMCYSGGMAIDPDNTNVIYCSVPVEGIFGKVYEIIKYTMSDDETEVIATEAVTKNSLKNNVRPFVIPDSVGRDIRLIWMHGDYYDWIVSNAYTTQGYCTAVMAEKPIPSNAAKTDDAIVCEDYAAIGGAFVSTTETANIVEASASGAFSVSADVYLEKEGQILDLGSVKLGVETRDTQYGANVTGERKRVVLTVNGTEYVTSNVYGTSDCWKSFNRGTGGNYGVSDYEGYVNLTLTYDGKYLTLYRDGLVDAKIEAAALSVDNVKVGGFGGMAENVSVYERALSRDDIKALADVDYAVEEPLQEGGVSVTCNYVDMSGRALLPSKTVTLSAGTDIYTPEREIVTDEGIFALDENLSVLEGALLTAVYYKTKKFVGDNLVTNGSFEDENGNFSVEGWLSPSTGATIGSPYTTNNFYAVGTDSVINNNVATSISNDIPDGSWALGTRWNDGTAGLCSIKRNISVVSGNEYYISYKVKHKTGDNGEYIRTSLIAEPAATTGDAEATEENNITDAGTVGTEWKTVTRTFTATDDTDNVLFWFRWLGGEGNPGNGPYWYFDDFKIYEMQDVQTVNITFDKNAVCTEGTISLGENGSLPEGVAGYSILSTDGTERFVAEGIANVSEGDIITTVPLNVTILPGAQVRYGGGVDGSGRVSDGNGIRFVASVDRNTPAAGRITGYGIEIKAESSDKVIEIPAEKWQDEAETVFTAAITNLNVLNYNRIYTARAYAVVNYDNGETTGRKVYSSTDTQRSIYQVAAGLMTDGSASDAYSAQGAERLYEVLNAYVNMVGIRLNYDSSAGFSMRDTGSGAYSGGVMFDVTSENISDGVYSITVTPITENVYRSARIMSYWKDFVRINNNHTAVSANISDEKYNADGSSVTFTFTVPKNN